MLTTKNDTQFTVENRASVNDVFTNRVKGGGRQLEGEMHLARGLKLDTTFNINTN